MRSTAIKSTFNTGEVSDIMEGRIGDFDRMKGAMSVSLNGFPLVQGPWTRRPGTGFCDEVRYSLKKTRVVPFVYSTTQAYTLEFGDQYVRVKKNRAPVYDSTNTITSITQGLPGVVTYVGTDPANGDDFDGTGVVGMSELNGRRVRVANVDTGANTFELTENDGSSLDTSIMSTYASGGTLSHVYALALPYLEADLFQLKFTRSVDKLYIFHPDYPEATLNRFADASWTHTPLVLLDGPYLPVNKTTTTFAVNVATVGAGRVLTASSGVGVNDNAGFAATDVGRLVRSKQTAGNWGYARITGYTSTTQVTIEIINAFGATTATTLWQLGLLSDTTGYSAAGTFAADRLVLGGCPYREARWDVSNTGDYTNFAETELDGTVTDSHAFFYTLTSERSQQIRWIKNSSNGLVFGTFEAEWLARPSVNAEAMTPTNRDAKESTSYGSEDIDALKVGSVILAPQKYGRRIREITYSYADNRLLAPDITVLANHILRADTGALSGLVEMAYQREQFPLVWVCRKDGGLAGLVYSEEDKVAAWSRHYLGGGGLAQSVCVTPSATGDYEELWQVVRRSVNGRTVQYNEYLRKNWEKGDSILSAGYLDCSLAYAGPEINVLTGLGHLIGETVSVLANGAVHPDRTVSATGSITLDYPITSAMVGYSYNSDGEILPFDSGSADGTAQGKKQRAHHVTFSLYQSGSFWAGPSFEKLRLQPIRTAMMGSGMPVQLQTRKYPIDGGFGDPSEEARICFRFNGPLPGTIRAIISRQETSDV